MSFYHYDDIPEDLREYFQPAPQIGQEATPDAFVAKMVEVFSEVRRVLKPDGTLWLNLGDTYFGGGRGLGSEKQQMNAGSHVAPSKIPDGLEPKDLCGIPWRVALALQADGWYLRQDIIWAKPNPMPESVTDRCTKAHEYIFLLSKSAKYFFTPIIEPAEYAGTNRGGSTHRYEQNSAGMDNKQYDTRNKRSVWTIQSGTFKGAHFATFPIELPTLCIQAGTQAGDTVLDPFFGAGTTGVAALRLGRDFIGCELNPEYAKIAQDRINAESPLLAPEVLLIGGER